MRTIIWIVGSPRSGTSFLTEFIGKFTDKKYNEPWTSHPIDRPKIWKFPPDAKSIVFKYCENWKNFHVLANHHTASLWLHCFRDPDNVVYSMAYPKEDSWPPRDLYRGINRDDNTNRERICMQRWYSNTLNSLALYGVLPSRYYEVQYEDMVPGLKKLAKDTGLEFDYDQFDFKEGRNIKPELDWNLNKPAKELRNVVKNYMKKKNGEMLVEFLNKRRPKMLHRVVI